jgi:hypothetical protein
VVSPGCHKDSLTKLYTPPYAHELAVANNSTECPAATAEAQHCYLATLFFHGLSNKTKRKSKDKSAVHAEGVTVLHFMILTTHALAKAASRIKKGIS